jgi:arylsulfatase A-like enzyme
MIRMMTMMSRLSPRSGRTTGVFLALFACCIAGEDTEAALGRSRPNFLVMVADDLTFRAVGVAGQSGVRTPNIDRLAGRGVRFSHAFIQGGLGGAVCVTSRATLMTGRSLWSCGKGGDCTRDGTSFYPLWGRVLGDAGYRTVAVGKWHNGKAALDAGFETARPVVLGGMLESTPQDGPAYRRPADGNPWSPDDPKWKGHWLAADGKTAHSSERWADAAIEHLGEASRGDRPFFLYVAFHAPHDPRQAPRTYLDMYPPASLSLPPNLLPRHPFDLGEFRGRDEVLAPYPRTEGIVRTHLSEYYAIISHLDAQVGRVLDALDRSGQADNTVVVLTADNGLAVGQHGLMGKQCLYDHSVRVPLVLAGPGVPVGKTVDALVYMPSLFATTCAMAGIETPATVEFPSLVPLITGREARLYEDVYAAYIDRQRMVRTDRWKLTITPAAGMVQLFAVDDDPWELHNLAGDPRHAGVVADLYARLKRWMTRVKDPLPFAKLDAALASFREGATTPGADRK